MSEPNKETLKLIAKCFKIINSELDILGIKQANTSAKPEYKTLYMALMSETAARALAKDLAIEKILSTKTIHGLLPELTMAEVINNSVFVACEKAGDRCEVVLLLKEKSNGA